MKWMFLLLCLLCFKTSLAGDVETFSAAWLKRGLAASAMVYSTNGKVSNECANWSIETACYYQGFINGINSGWMLDADSKSRLFYPDRGMVNLMSAHSGILDFINKNKASIKEQTLAWNVLLAWYLTTHSKSTADDKAKAMLALTMQINPQKKP